MSQNFNIQMKLAQKLATAGKTSDALKILLDC